MSIVLGWRLLKNLWLDWMCGDKISFVIWVNWPFNSNEDFEYEHQPFGSFVMFHCPNILTDCHLLTPIKSCIFSSLSSSDRSCQTQLQFIISKESCVVTWLKTNTHINTSPALGVWTPHPSPASRGFGATVSVYTNKYNPPLRAELMPYDSMMLRLEGDEH